MENKCDTFKYSNGTHSTNLRIDESWPIQLQKLAYEQEQNRQKLEKDHFLERERLLQYGEKEHNRYKNGRNGNNDYNFELPIGNLNMHNNNLIILCCYSWSFTRTGALQPVDNWNVCLRKLSDSIYARAAFATPQKYVDKYEKSANDGGAVVVLLSGKILC